MRNRLFYLIGLLAVFMLVNFHNLFAQQGEAEQHYALAGSYMMQGEYKKAEDEFKFAIESDSSYTLAYYGLGTLYSERIERLDDAILIFKEGISIAPSDRRLYLGLSTAYLKTGNLNNAEKTLKDLLMIYPEDQEAQENLKIIRGLKENNISKEEVIQMFK